MLQLCLGAMLGPYLPICLAKTRGGYADPLRMTAKRLGVVLCACQRERFSATAGFVGGLEAAKFDVVSMAHRSYSRMHYDV